MPLNFKNDKSEEGYMYDTLSRDKELNRDRLRAEQILELSDKYYDKSIKSTLKDLVETADNMNGKGRD